MAEIINIDGSDRQRKYPAWIIIRNAGNEKEEAATAGKITIVEGRPREPKRNTGILILVSELKTSIEFSKSNEEFISPVLESLKKWKNIPWNRTYRGLTITTRIKLTDSEIERLKNLIEEITKS